MVRELTPDLARIASEELNEKPSQLKDDLQHLKDWISKQPYLKARTDDQWLVALLRGCKFSLEKVKKKLDLYYSIRTTAPDVTMRLKPCESAYLDFLRLGTCLILPKSKSQPLFPRVILIRPGAYDPDKNNVADIMCILYYLVQVLVVEDDVAAVIGTKVLVDYTDVSMSHFAQGPPLLKKIVAVCQDTMPLRLKGSHHMNVPSGIELIFSLISNFLDKKARDRMKLHKNYEELQENLPKDVIPAEYGGNGGTIKEITEYWVSKMKEYKAWMQEEMRFGTDESLRPGKPADKEGFSDVGSFRKLDID